ncbi:cation:proton antiporter [Pleurocapsales cyanobacterium LEGE 06147]|nr:cation:proton antiporter [Pleurocapsales cyanobacterium LEGE 06147]
MESFSEALRQPVVDFAILLAVILTMPPLFERLKLPGLVGLLVAGVLLGSSGLNLLNSNSETMKLLSDIGKIYLMFVAGLEIDLELFRRTRNRSLGFGFTTFAIPLTAGTIVGRLFGMDWNASVLIGSLLASHTLLAYPIVRRLGVVNDEAVTVTVGATIFTDIGALLVLAICVGINQGDFSTTNLVTLLLSLAIYATAILFGLDWLGKEFFRRTKNYEGNQFLFVLLALFLSSVGAQLIGVEQIVGAFLAGLAVNDVVGNCPVKEKVEFVGSVLFIPIFFVNMGLLLDLQAFMKTLDTIGLTLLIVGGLIGSKFLAAFVVKGLYRYSWRQTLTMWSLSLPQVAATLAAAVVGFQENIIGESVLNSVILMMLVTAVLGPLITSRAAAKLVPETIDRVYTDADFNTSKTGNSVQSLPVVEKTTADSPSVVESNSSEIALRISQGNNFTPFLSLDSDTTEDVEPLALEQFSSGAESKFSRRRLGDFTVVVPISNPETERYLIEMATLVARHEGGRIVPLAIAPAQARMDSRQMDLAISRSQEILVQAKNLSRELGVEAKPLLRIDCDVAAGIAHAAREENAKTIVLGMSDRLGLRARLFGNLTDSVLWSAHCLVLVARLLDSPLSIKRILVPVENLTAWAIRPIRFAQIIAQTNQAEITLIHVCNPKTEQKRILALRNQLLSLFADSSSLSVKVQIVPGDNIIAEILKAASDRDLVVLRSQRRRIGADGLASGQISTPLLKQLSCSVVLFGVV